MSTEKMNSNFSENAGGGILHMHKIGNIRQFGLVFVLLALIIAMTILSNKFFTTSNFINVARQVSVTAVTAVGMTLIIIIGGIDLSVGSVLAFAGVIAASAFNLTHSPFLSVVLALVIGAIIGFVNGYVTARGNIGGFITTLATMSIVRGLGYIYTGGYPIASTDPKFTFWGTGHLGPIPVPILIMLIILVMGHFITTQTRFGRYVYALGGNEQATKWTGIDVNKVKTAVYTITGLLTGLSGIILAGRLSSGQPAAGQDFAMDVIAGVIVGGTSLQGGKGTIWGTFMGVLLIGIVSNGLTLLDVSSYYQMVVKGLIILFAVLLDTFSKKS